MKLEHLCLNWHSSFQSTMRFDNEMLNKWFQSKNLLQIVIICHISNIYIYICMCKLIIKVKSIRYVYRIVVRWHFIREYATRSSSCWFFFISDASYINIYAIATRRYKRDSWNFERYNNKIKIANQLCIEFIRQIQQFEGQFYHFHRNFSVDV